MEKITLEYILDKYNLVDERESREVALEKGEIDLEFNGLVTKKEFLALVSKQLDYFDDNLLFRYDNGWGPDDQDVIVAIDTQSIPESDTEVIERLKLIENHQRSEENALTKAKKLLKDNGFKVQKEN